MNDIPKRLLIQRKQTVKGAELWLDGIGGHDVDAGRRVLSDVRKMYPRETFRLVQVVVEDTENTS